jgi:hypothetical protein
MSDWNEAKFRDWLRKVDAVVRAKTGMSYDDLPDYCYADRYEEGARPATVANEAIRAAMYD